VSQRDERLPWSVVLGYGSGAFAQGLLPLIVASWLMYFYSPPAGEGVLFLSPALFGTIRLLERGAGAFLEPIVGHLSDRTRSRFGRRMPWIAAGLPIVCLSFAALFFPPAGEATDSIRVVVHLAVALMLFFASYTAVFAPYSALHPELSSSTGQRVRLSVWMAIFEVASNVFGSLAAAPLVGLGAMTVLGIALANGFELLVVVSAGLAFLSVLPVLLFTKERHVPEAARSLGFVEAVRVSLANEAFLRYGALIFALRASASTAVIGIPFIATELMGSDEEGASYMLAIIIVVATLAFPMVQRLADRHGKKRVMRWGAIGYVFTLPLMGAIGLVPIPPLVHGMILFVLTGFSTATLFVLPRPLLADVIDLDEKRTGLRREAMYTGMSGVLEKLGEAFAGGAVGYLFQWFGNSASQPLGLRLLGLAGAVTLAGGLFVFRRYPLP
jgi:GPH family glycoside/pentoside/hexuronide:cation symporter